MAGTANNYDTTTIIVDRVAQVWAGVAAPAANARITLAADPGDASISTPDATENPNAIHLGFTKEGSKITIVSNLVHHYADEIDTPIFSTVEQTDATIEGEFLQIMDVDVMTKLSAPFGTAGAAAGYKQYQIGKKTLTYTGICVIWPSSNDATKFGILHLYSAMNTAGVGFGISRKGMSSTPFKFQGYAVASRASADRLGCLWWQV